MMGAAIIGFLGTVRTVIGMLKRVQECCGGGGAAAPCLLPLLPIGETEMTAVPPPTVPTPKKPNLKRQRSPFTILSFKKKTNSFFFGLRV